ncbi:MAG: hypothetical protein IKK75_12665 [Clostridia bacterium]|nr:hypothetical protein [Clostridia bacterium]
MRLLIAWPNRQSASAIRDLMEGFGWDVEMAQDGRQICSSCNLCDVLLMHLCLPGMDGLSAGDSLALSAPLRPPRVMFAAPQEWCVHHPPWADCTVDAGTSLSNLCRLILLVSQKPLPKLAAVRQTEIASAVEMSLDALGFSRRMKGRQYAAWLLQRIIPSTCDDQLALLYAECALHFSTTPAAVERCLRTAVESVFTRGSMTGIEHFFGATVDPERGKPTNRAFLMQTVEQLRTELTYSRATALSLNSSVMHHRPAAPTSV